MRTRESIEKDGTRVDMLSLEVLLDIRELMLDTRESLKKLEKHTPVCVKKEVRK